jgi:hypothetical protein
MTAIKDRSEAGARVGTASAIVLAILALAASGFLVARYVVLREELRRASAALELKKSRAATAALDAFALPANRKLAVCNTSGAEATITAVAAFYTDREGVLRNFNSAASQWPTWTVAANATRKIDFSPRGVQVWDGSVLFYAMDVTVQGQSRLLSGTSDDLKTGCIALAGEKAGRGNRSQ